MKHIFQRILCGVACLCLLCSCSQEATDSYEYQKQQSGIEAKLPTNKTETEIFATPTEEITPSPAPTSESTQENTPFPNENAAKPSEKSDPTDTSTPTVVPTGTIIVLDPGHGKSSSLMSDEEKTASGYTFVQGKGWGEWRHFKSGTMWQDCEGSGCSGRAPQNGGCWYSIGSGDRDTEPDLNYQNAQNAKKYLEQRGYTVRMTRGQNESPSITKRIKQCYPNEDTSLQPDASAYICIHSNAGGGRGSCYISLSGLYDQSGIPQNYIEIGNSLGKSINDSIIQNTSMPLWGNGAYTGYPELVLFCKSPVPVAYMEIGFYDNATDLNILQSESDKIGYAIAQGIDNYYKQQ